MATKETVKLGESHIPTEASIKAFDAIEADLKKELKHQFHELNKHEPEYFYAVKDLTPEQLTNFTSDDLKEVRVGETAYGKILFGKVLIPEANDKYIHFRAFIPDSPSSAKFHSIRMDQLTVSNSALKASSDAAKGTVAQAVETVKGLVGGGGKEEVEGGADPKNFLKAHSSEKEAREKDGMESDKVFKAVFGGGEELVWFNE